MILSRPCQLILAKHASWMPVVAPGVTVCFFKEHGFQVTALDGCEELARLAARHIGQEVHVMRYEDIPWVNAFDGIWASAALVHHSPDEAVVALNKFATALVQGGILFTCFKYGQGILDDGERQFTLHDEASLADVMARVPGLSAQKIWTTDDVVLRPGLSWINVLARKSAPS